VNKTPSGTKPGGVLVFGLVWLGSWTALERAAIVDAQRLRSLSMPTPRLATPLILTLIAAFGLACLSGRDKGDDDGGGLFGGRDDDTRTNGPVLPVDVAQVFYVTSDAEGRYYPDDLDTEAELCPPGATYLGGNGYAAACLDEGVKGVYGVIGNADRKYYPDDVSDPAAICPGGSSFVGLNSWYHTCVSDKASAQVSLFYNAAGDYIDETDVRDFCPGGTTALGYAYYGSGECGLDGARGVVTLTVDAQGRYVEDVDSAADLCPAGWEFMGTSWYGSTVCAGDVGAVVSLTYDAQGRYAEELDDPAEICPAGSEYLGGYSYTQYCYIPERVTPVYLTRDAEGRTTDDVEAAEMCPDGFEYIGGSSYAAVCVR
jgi:hypothetical protein